MVFLSQIPYTAYIFLEIFYMSTVKTEDVVNHPKHYNQYEGFEVIDVCEQLIGPDGKSGFNLGNAFKYIARAGWKNPETHVEDLEKAAFYIQREIQRLQSNSRMDSDPNIITRQQMLDRLCGNPTHSHEGLVVTGMPEGSVVHVTPLIQPEDLSDLAQYGLRPEPVTSKSTAGSCGYEGCIEEHLVAPQVVPLDERF